MNLISIQILTIDFNKCIILHTFRELSSTFARLCRTVDTATTDMNDELKTLEAQLAVLESNQKQLKLLRNKANYIQNELEIFENNYIKSN